MKKFISALLTLILMTYIITPIPAKAASSEYYELTPEDEKWNTLTLEEKRKTCELNL